MGLSTIQWCDYSWNPWIGCRKVAAECANCYAETLDRNRYSKTLAPGTKANPVSHWGSGPRHRTKTWGDPLKWNRLAGSIDWLGFAPTVRPRVFCASLADWLDDENVPIEWFADLLGIFEQCNNLDWLTLTKRPKNWRRRLEQVVDLYHETMRSENPGKFSRGGQLAERWLSGSAPHNVWIGVSAGADQQAALDIPARVHFLSCEPMLRPLGPEGVLWTSRFDWAIFGGESGSKARECHTDWIRDGVAFCRLNGIAPFVKQLGSNCLAAGNDQKYLIAMKDSHGGDMDEWPEDLRVREFPTVR